MQYNPILDLTDSYKLSHFAQYPPGTDYVYSYVESRGGDNENTIFFGLQAFLLEYMSQKVTSDHVIEAAATAKLHGVPFNQEGWQLLVDRHQGRFPIAIRAVAEGTLVPTKNVLADIVNTDPDFFWLTSYLETALLRAIWYPTTVATRDFYIKRNIAFALKRTSDTADKLPVMLNDFGARGASSLETARLGGLGHLAVFQGTDNLAAVRAASAYYDAEMAGVSLPAAEHSTMTSWGRDAETDAYRNMVTQFKDGGILAVVSDSYDIFNAVENIWGGTLLEEVRNAGATIVVRPDSGDPIETPIRVIESLMAKAGHTVNGKGYKLLPDYFRVIQGDGVDPDAIAAILDGMERRGLSADNIAFGMGGGMLQKLDRDTQKFAMKCSAVHIADHGWRDVFKDPVTDPGKASKKGRLELLRDGGRIYTDRQDSRRKWRDGEISLLEDVYLDGEVLRRQSLDDIRSRIDTHIA